MHHLYLLRWEAISFFFRTRLLTMGNNPMLCTICIFQGEKQFLLSLEHDCWLWAIIPCYAPFMLPNTSHTKTQHSRLLTNPLQIQFSHHKRMRNQQHYKKYGGQPCTFVVLLIIIKRNYFLSMDNFKEFT
jgi:hypothetical protein